jgi:integral membrane protein
MINIYRRIAIIEGISYLILLFIAMPIKYILDISEPVKYFGWIHGVLFLVYMVILIIASIKYRWSLKRIAIYLIGSVLPFVPFILDKNLKKEYQSINN